MAVIPPGARAKPRIRQVAGYYVCFDSQHVGSGLTKLAAYGMWNRNATLHRVLGNVRSSVTVTVDPHIFLRNHPTEYDPNCPPLFGSIGIN